MLDQYVYFSCSSQEHSTIWYRNVLYSNLKTRSTDRKLPFSTHAMQAIFWCAIVISIWQVTFYRIFHRGPQSTSNRFGGQLKKLSIKVLAITCFGNDLKCLQQTVKWRGGFMRAGLKCKDSISYHLRVACINSLGTITTGWQNLGTDLIRHTWTGIIFLESL